MMREFVVVSDINDELVAKVLLQEDIDYANNKISDIALDLDVDPFDIPVDPAPFKVKELAKAHACEHALMRKTGLSPGSKLGQDGIDAYGYKRRVFISKINDIMATLTARSLTGARGQDSMFIIPIGRG
jgi:hypothetical protein